MLKDKKHPNLPMIYEVCTDDAGITVLEEYVEGKRLADILSNNLLDKKTACKYVSKHYGNS